MGNFVNFKSVLFCNPRNNRTQTNLLLGEATSPRSIGVCTSSTGLLRDGRSQQSIKANWEAFFLFLFRSSYDKLHASNNKREEIFNGCKEKNDV